MSSSTARAAAGLAATFLVAGCSYLNSTFNQTVDSGTRDHIHGSVPIGSSMVSAESSLSSQGFNCEKRSGNFTDEQGRGRSGSNFLSCVRRSGQVSFACENRDQVVVLPDGGVVDEVDVVRGPDCERTPGPALTPPNAGE